MILAELAKRNPQFLQEIPEGQANFDITPVLEELTHPDVLNQKAPGNAMPPEKLTYVEARGPKIAELLGLTPDASECPKVAFNTTLVTTRDADGSDSEFGTLDAHMLFQQNMQRFIPNTVVQAERDYPEFDQEKYATALCTVLTIKLNEEDNYLFAYTQTHLRESGTVGLGTMIAPLDADSQEFIDKHQDGITLLHDLLLAFFELNRMFPYDVEVSTPLAEEYGSELEVRTIIPPTY